MYMQNVDRCVGTYVGGKAKGNPFDFSNSNPYTYMSGHSIKEMEI